MGWDPDWWKKARDESLERKVAAEAAENNVQVGDSFLIVTEGTVTEPVYFEYLLKELELSRVWVKVIPGKASDPQHVIQTAKELSNKQKEKADRGQLGVQEPRKFDHTWAVVDTDVAVREKFWNDVCQFAEGKAVSLAHSTPCFEFWLLLHFELTTRGDLLDGTSAKAAVKEKLGQDYSTNEETTRKAISTLIKSWPSAVRNAEKVRDYHFNAGTSIPANPSTMVDFLVRGLNDSASAHLRKL